MKLNAEIIYHELKKHYVISPPPKEPRNVPLASPMLYDGVPFRKNHIYIMEAQDFAFLKDETEDVALIVTGTPLIQLDPCPWDVFFIPEDVPFRTLFNQITEIFDRLNAWEQELMQYEGDFANIQKMLACSHDILGGTLTLADDNFNLLAFTNDLLQRQDYYDSSTPTRTPQELIEAALEDPDFRSCLGKRNVFLYPEYQCSNNALCYNLFREGADVYYARLILMNDSNDYSGREIYLLRFLGEILHRTLSRVSTISLVNSVYQDLGDLIRKVLKEAPRHVSAILPTLQKISWDINDKYVVTVLSSPFEQRSAIQSRSFCNQLEMLLEETCAIIYGEHIVFVSNVSRSDTLRRENIDNILTIFLRENLFKAGISNCLLDFSRLSMGYQEALAALELGNSKAPSLWYYHFSDYIIDYVIQASSKDFPFTDFIDERLLLLIDYDKKNGSQLFETLKTYIQYKYNATRAAEALYIHRTTFLSRLDRILQLTHYDIDDWNTRLILMLSIYALEN